MAATMEDETSTTDLASDNIRCDSGSSTVVSNTLNETFDPDTSLEKVSVSDKSQQNIELSDNQLQESAVSSSCLSSFTIRPIGLPKINRDSPKKLKTFNPTTTTDESIKCSNEINRDSTKSTTVSMFKKPMEKGFKLPQLPSPLSSKSGVITKSDNDELENQTKTSESMEETAELQYGGEQFEFSKPKLAQRPQQKKESHSRDSSQSLQSSSLVPESAEKKQTTFPAEKLAKAPPLPYKEPVWSGSPSEEYYLEVLKGGSIISKIDLTDKAFHVFGRLETCDIPLEHPSLSRYHLVLQYRLMGDSEHDPGFYLYDLGSTHGSWFNKQQMQGRVYYRIRVGSMFKLGGSSRMYLLQGPSEDQEAESELSVKELKELRQQQLVEQEERKRKKREEEEADRMQDEEKNAGISWGMEEDAEEADGMGDNPFAIMTHDEKEATCSYIKDPKKALKGYFVREGYDLEYNMEEKESGFNKQFVCKIELPLDDTSGRPIFAEAAVSGKKKEAVLACALEACRILDAHGVLRQSTHESRKRKAKNWKEEDYYDSDDDTFLDRTGAVEKKRILRMKKAGMIKEEAQTYDSLKSQLSAVQEEIKRIEHQMSTSSKSSASVIEDDSLDAFMASIKSGKMVDKTWRAKLKLQLIELKKDQARLIRLVNIAKPATMPALQKPSTQTSFATLSKKLPMFGSMKGRIGLKNKMKTSIPSATAVPSSSQGVAPSTGKMIDVEVEDEQEEDEHEAVVSPPATHGSAQHLRSAWKPADETTRVASALEPTSSTASKDKMIPAQSKRNPPPRRKLGPTIPIKFRTQNGREKEESADTRETTAPSGMREVDSLKRMPQSNMEEEEGKSSPERTKAVLAGREMKETEEKEDVADWMPPVGQTGDGRTHLNEKFGY